MKSTSSLVVSALLLGAGLSFAFAARAGDGCSACSPASVTTAAVGAFDLAQAKAAYPLDTCVVSGDKLEGDMGGPVDYVHKEPGKPDRLVRFCCKSCIKDFKKDPAKYLKQIDAAAATKTAAATKS